MVAYTEHGLPTSGTTAQRPTNAEVGFRYFDTTIGQELIWNGTAFVLPGGSTAAVTAVNAAGSAQGNAAALTTGTSVVGAADGTKGVRLPTAVANQECLVINDDNNNAALKVYPATGATINLLSANTAISMPTNTSALFKAVSATRWVTNPRVPS